LTTSGLVYLLKAYYKPSIELSEKFELFLNSKSHTKKKLYAFFHLNPLDFRNTKETLYFMNLHMEILKSEKTGKTQVMLEIDQTASGIVFYQ